jgi:hypothetical protein
MASRWPLDATRPILPGWAGRFEIKRKLTMALYAFFDDSGSWPDKSANIVCLSGYLSDDRHWAPFCEKWKVILDEAHLPVLHSTKLNWSSPDTSLLVNKCIAAIRETIIFGMGISVGFDAAHYRTLSAGHQKNLGSPTLICFKRVMEHLLRGLYKWSAAGMAIPPGSLQVTVDDTDAFATKILSCWLSLRRRSFQLRSLVGSFQFADDKYAPPLQAADLLANLTTRYWRENPHQEPQGYLKDLLTAKEDNGRPFLLQTENEFINAEQIDEAIRKNRPL